jgi:hypothetical protein
MSPSQGSSFSLAPPDDHRADSEPGQGVQRKQRDERQNPHGAPAEGPPKAVMSGTPSKTKAIQMLYSFGVIARPFLEATASK